jgi:hypothetical protein
LLDERGPPESRESHLSILQISISSIAYSFTFTAIVDEAYGGGCKDRENQVLRNNEVRRAVNVCKRVRTGNLIGSISPFAGGRPTLAGGGGYINPQLAKVKLTK